MSRVTVLLTPAAGEVPARATAVVVDVLRASTTLTVARRNGAREVLEAATPEEAFAHARGHPGALLCGERDGRKIPGFDLGNSPLEYGPETVGGRTLVFASTNGSQALRRAACARRRLLGAFVNADAVARAVADEPEVVIVCSGKLGRFCIEDAAFAGWLAARLAAAGARVEGAAARLARTLAPRDAAAVRALLQGAAQGRHLRSLGPEYAADLEFCAGLDRIGEAYDV
ncbi:MAG: 2-phosphosulfolactate phosphatase [Candidatus Eisenbacteria bacterium]|nr:2-phosphosulfolactate phosphatase [Candidatus Eisenbacteria bacterium]